MSPTPVPWTPTDLGGESVVALAVRGRAAFAALEDGRVLRSDDGGGRWVAVGPGAAPSDGVTALLATPRALLVATFDGLFRAGRGRPWTPASGLPDGAVVALQAVGRGVVAGTLRAGAFRSDDEGQSWSAAVAGLPLGGAGLEVHTLAAGDAGLFAAHAFGLSRSGDGGRSWGPPGVGLPLVGGRLDLAAAGAVYAGAAGRLYRTADGVGWVEVYDGPGAGRPLRLLGGADGALYAADAAGALHRSADGGTTWGACSDGLPGSPESVAAAAGWLLAALGPEGLWRRPLDAPPDRPAAPAEAPVEVDLEASDPNPFTDATEIAFSLSASAEVVLTVHDLFDAEVARVAEGRYGPGTHRVQFLARALPAGLYRCRLTAAGRSQARSMLLLK